MAENNNREFLNSDEVKLKKYFYVLRPILACEWINRRGETPPIEFEKLLEMVNDKEILREIRKLLAMKKAGTELGTGPKIAVLNKFIETALARYATAANDFSAAKKTDNAVLDKAFIDILEYSEKLI